MGYDAQPYKLRPCPNLLEVCSDAFQIRQTEMPPATVALPHVDHWHIMARGGADNRDAKDLQHWRSLMLSTVRCEHGRLQGDVCYGCPSGYSPDRSGTRIGTTYDGRPVVTPDRVNHNKPSAWIPGVPQSGPTLSE